MGRRKPDTSSAVVDINTLKVKPPKVKELSPLEVVVEQSFDSIIEAVVEKGYSLTDICQMLRKRGIRPNPKSLKLAMLAYAEKNNRDLPKPFHLTPRSGSEENDNESVASESEEVTETEQGKSIKVPSITSSIASPTANSIASQFNV